VRVRFEEKKVEGWFSLRYRKRAVLPMRGVCGRTVKRERERKVMLWHRRKERSLEKEMRTLGET
jgi:hypothetical protein